MTRLDRLISCVHCGPLVSTISVPATSLTVVARSSAGPTVLFQAKVTLPSDNGVVRSSSISAAGTTWLRGRITGVPEFQRSRLPGSGFPNLERRTWNLGTRYLEPGTILSSRNGAGV